MKNVLIVDVETNGIDPLKNKIVEVGAVLYSIEHQTTLSQVSVLGHADSNECQDINRIPESAVISMVEHTDLFTSCRDALKTMQNIADAYVAHHSEFDQSFLGWDDKPWVCTCFDVQWPKATKQGGSLINIALEHGIGVSSAHRALTDCQLIAALFDRVDDLPGLIAHAIRPKAVFQALVSYDDRQLAKDAGFKWDGQNKLWTRRMALEDAKSLPFQVREISDA